MTVAMFGFGFLLVPLYDVFCEITGFGGRTNAEAAVVAFQNAYEHPTVNEFSFLPFADRSVTDRLLESLRKAGLPE